MLSSIDSDESLGDMASRNIGDNSSNRELKTNDNRTDAQKSNTGGKDQSIILSDLGISISDDKAQALKGKLKQKQDELLRTEYELAKAKSDFIEIMRELSTFHLDFFSLRKRLEAVKSAWNALKQQKTLSVPQIQNSNIICK